MFINALCLMALSEFVTSHPAAILREHDELKNAEFRCVQGEETMLCVIDTDSEALRDKLVDAGPRISEDYVDWSDFITNRVDFDDSQLEQNNLKLRKNHIVRRNDLHISQTSERPLKDITDANAPVTNIEQSIVQTTEAYETILDLESEEYVILPKKTQGEYVNNVIDVKKYMRPRIRYMQGSDRIVLPSALRGLRRGLRRARFLPKRYRYDRDFSKIGTFWDNGHRWEI